MDSIIAGESEGNAVDGGSSERNYWALLLLLLCVVVVFGNVLVILSVAREKLLQNITNFFIVSLAVADLLVAGFVMPFSVYVLVNWGMWGLPKMVCDFYIALDVVCSTSSIFNLVAISIDRYYAVTAPIKYSQHRDNHSRAYVFIVVCWIASTAIGSPIMLGANPIPPPHGNDDINDTSVVNATATTIQHSSPDESDEEFVCAFYNPDFIIYSSLGSFYIPCFVMIFLYARIFKALHERATMAKMAKKRQQYHHPGGGDKRSNTVVTDKKGTAAVTVAETDMDVGQAGKTSAETGEKKVFVATCNGNLKAENNTVVIDIRVEDASGGVVVEEGEIPSKPNKVSRACGPDTSFYQRSSRAAKAREKENNLNSTASSSNLNVKARRKRRRSKVSFFLPDSSSSSSSSSAFCLLLPCIGASADSKAPAAELEEGDSSTATSQQQHRNSGTSAPISPPAEESLSSNRLARMLRMHRINRGSRKSKKKRKEKTAARKERKATQTLAIVLGCFLVCWVPFFTCNILNAVCIKFELTWGPGDTSFIITTWLGYINSCVNPLIYTIFNPEFRKAFKKILGLGH